MPRKMGPIVLVLVLVLCTASAAYARPLDREAPGGGASLRDTVGRFLDWMGRVLDGGNGLLSVSGWEGSHLDPNGNPIT